MRVGMVVVVAIVYYNRYFIHKDYKNSIKGNWRTCSFYLVT